MLRRLIPVLIFLSLVHFGLEAKACSCSRRSSVYEEFHDASAVFVGKVIGSRGAPVTEIIGDQPRQFTETIFQFSVSEAFKGVKGSQIEISVGVVRISCYHTFNIGGTYLVYAFGNEKIPSSVYCSRTRNFEDAASDLHYIRELLRGVPEPRVYGSVKRVETVVERDKAVRRAIPVSGVKVSIEGEGNHFEVVTDQRGLYRLEKIPDGKYKAHPLLPDQYKFRLWSFEEFTLSQNPDIFSGKAATSDFYVEWKNELVGEILDSEGNRIERAKVNVLFPRNRAPIRIEGHEFYRPGGFGFSGLIPGKYLLSVNIKPPFEDKTKPTYFYYPGTLNLDQAERIEIGIDQTINKNIRLPPGYLVREITGVLVWPNGEPISDGRVTLTGSKDSVDEGDFRDSSITDKLGRFSVQAFVGAEYWIYGKSRSSEQGESIKIKVEKTNEPLKIVLRNLLPAITNLF